MSWSVKWQVRCEKCKKPGPIRKSGDLAEKAAEKKGWELGHCYGMAMHLCPDCVAEGLPEWWPDATGKRFHWEPEAV